MDKVIKNIFNVPVKTITEVNIFPHDHLAN